MTFPEDFLLVLDDYHLTDTRGIDDALTFLLAHLPVRWKNLMRAAIQALYYI